MSCWCLTVTEQAEEFHHSCTLVGYVREHVCNKDWVYVQSDLSAVAETSRFSCFVYTTQLKDIRIKRTVSCFDSSIIHSLHYGLPWWSITVKNKPASKTWNKPELNLKSTPVTYIPAVMCPNKCFLFVLSDRNILSFFMGSYLCYLERRSEEDGHCNGKETRKFKEMILCP